MHKNKTITEKGLSLMNNNSEHSERGLSLIEILVVITIFAMLGLLISGSLILSIRGAKKSESMIKVRENLNYAVAVVERNLRNASSITNCIDADTTISYLDQYGKAGSFSCEFGQNGGYLASGSGKIRITAEDIDLGSCNFTCDGTNNPPSVVVDLEGAYVNTNGAEGSVVSISSTVYLRNSF